MFTFTKKCVGVTVIFANKMLWRELHGQATPPAQAHLRQQFHNPIRMKMTAESLGKHNYNLITIIIIIIQVIIIYSHFMFSN